MRIGSLNSHRTLIESGIPQGGGAQSSSPSTRSQWVLSSESINFNTIVMQMTPRCMLSGVERGAEKVVMQSVASNTH